MPSPQRPARGSPPKRAALHDRSDSSTNERSLRMIGDPQAPIYGSPYPTKPSEVLLPKGYKGPAIGAGLGVSHRPIPPNETNQYIGNTSTPADLQARNPSPEIGSADNVSSTRPSSTDTPFYTPQSTTLGLGTGNTFFPLEPALDEEGRISDDIVQLPSVPSRAEPSDSYAQNASNTSVRQPIEKDSDNSLSSSNSTGTVIVKKNRDGKKRASYSAFPNVMRPSSSKSNIPPFIPAKLLDKSTRRSPSPESPVSPSSPVSPAVSTPTDRQKTPSPIYSNTQAASQSSLNLQYPVIRPPSASASFADPPSSFPQQPQRVFERNPDRWNPHLSTVPSEGTGSQSEGRSSQSMGALDSTRVSKSSSMAFTGRGSSDQPPIPSPPPVRNSAEIPSLPNSPPPIRHRDFSGSTIRVVNEEDDSQPNVMPTIPGSRGSEHLGRSHGAGENRQSLVTRPASRASFFRDSIPAWARAYYGRPQSSASYPREGHNSRPSTSTDNISLNIFRPRTRNNRGTNGQSHRDSLAIGPARPSELDLAEIRGPPRRRVSPSWSPHLWHDRTSLGRRRTIFKAPSIDEQAEGSLPSKRNAQILLFAIGFVFPPGWFIASVLPLPQRPELTNVKGKENASNRTQLTEDLEKQLGPIDEARYENARWWRNINRMMSLVGIVIIIAVIALAVVSAT